MIYKPQPTLNGLTESLSSHTGAYSIDRFETSNPLNGLKSRELLEQSKVDTRSGVLKDLTENQETFRRIRILYVINGLGTGGAENMLLKLLSRLDHSHFAAAVFALQRNGALLSEFEALGIPVYGTTAGPLTIFSTLRDAVREFRPDLVQGWMYHGNLGAHLASFLSPNHPPIVTHITHNPKNISQLKRTTRLVLKIGGWLSNKASRIVYPATAAKQSHERLGYNPVKGIVIPNGFEIDAFKPSQEVRKRVRSELGISDDTVLLGCVGRFHPHKDHINLFRALKILNKNYPQLRCLFVGDGLESTEPAIAKILLDDELKQMSILLGRRKDIPDLMQALDIFVNPSATEAFPLVLGEAMLSGLPCAVTNVGDCATVLGPHGRLVPPQNPAALAQAISSLVDLSHTARQEIGAAARAQVVRLYSLPSVVQQYQDMYLQIVGHAICTQRVSSS